MPNSRRTPPRGARGTSRPGHRPSATRARAQATTREAPPRPRFTGRAAILVLVLAVLMVSYASSMRAYLEQRSHLESLRSNISESEQNIDQLKREKRRWNDPAYVQAQARQRFGYVMPGEIGYQVIGEDGRPLDDESSLTDPDAVAEANQPLWWQTAWQTVEAAGNPEQVEVPAGQIGTIKKKKR